MTTNLQRAKTKKDDEFYTRLVDIENELKYYKEHFKNKIVYCNCDDAEWSNFFIYFRNNFTHLGLKKLISTHYSLDIKSDTAYQLVCTEYSLDNNGIPIEHKSILNGNGDFRSAECIKLLEEADIVCTNPPFSLFVDYIKQLSEYSKKFLIIGNANAITYKQVFKLIKNNNMWLGVSPRSMEFYKTIDRTESKKVNACWFTNLQHNKRNENIILWQKYEPTLFPKYDNFDAIEVSKTNDIPIDYKGIMGVPITFLEKYNPEQFEIVGCCEPCINLDTLKNKLNFKEYKSRQIKYKGILCQKTYHRILIKTK